jgi:hypothetical protein
VSPETIRQICWIERDSAELDEIIRELNTFNARDWQIELIASVMVESIRTSQEFEPVIVEVEQNDAGKAKSER